MNNGTQVRVDSPVLFHDRFFLRLVPALEMMYIGNADSEDQAYDQGYDVIGNIERNILDNLVLHDRETKNKEYAAQYDQ
jgi:hypothetical protein